MKNPATITFYPYYSKKTLKDKLKIYMRVIVNRKKNEINTGYDCLISEWDTAKQRVKNNSLINKALSDLENKVYRFVQELQDNNQEITSKAIKDSLIVKNKVNKESILDFFRAYIVRLETLNELHSKTISRFKRVLNQFTLFLVHKNVDSTKFKFDDLNYELIVEFDSFLNRAELNLSRNTINGYHKKFKTVLIDAEKCGQLKQQPYHKFKLKNTKTNRGFLGNDELQKINDLDLSEHEKLDKVRDIFMFSVFTGLRFEDAQRLTIDNISYENNELSSIQFIQEKTNEQITIPLLDQAKVIILKYDLIERKITKKILPRISNQKENEYLKILAEFAGIKKRLTHHVARHTFATTITLSNGIPIEIVSKLLGHSNLRTTQIYGKITDENLNNSIKNLNDRLKE